MEAIALILTKFSEELIALQLALLFSALSVAVYWMLVRKKKRETAEWVPAAVVRAYLDRARAEEREVRAKLFGESVESPAAHAPLAAALGTVASDPSLLKEIEAMRAQLAAADQKFLESDRSITSLRAEKAALEQKLLDAQKAAPAAAGAPAGASDPALQKELEELRARLQEYEVIEDDLANLKKFQKENEQLRQKLEELGQSAPAAAAPAPEPAAAPEPAVSLVKEAPPAAEPEAAPAPVAEAAPAAEAPAAGGDAPAEKSAKQKEDELLSEFEKMLAS